MSIVAVTPSISALKARASMLAGKPVRVTANERVPSSLEIDKPRPLPISATVFSRTTVPALADIAGAPSGAPSRLSSRLNTPSRLKTSVGDNVAGTPGIVDSDTGKGAGCCVYPGYNVGSIKAGSSDGSPGNVGSDTGKGAGCCVYPGYNVGSIKAGSSDGSPGNVGSDTGK
jgi:hypothetical protein